VGGAQLKMLCGSLWISQWSTVDKGGEAEQRYRFIRSTP